MNNYGYLGVVRNDRFEVLAAEHPVNGPMRLSTFLQNTAQSIETGEIILTQYTSMVLMVRGMDSGEWIYGATITEQATGILARLVQTVYGAMPEQERFSQNFSDL